MGAINLEIWLPVNVGVFGAFLGVSVLMFARWAVKYALSTITGA